LNRLNVLMIKKDEIGPVGGHLIYVFQPAVDLILVDSSLCDFRAFLLGCVCHRLRERHGENVVRMLVYVVEIRYPNLMASSELHGLMMPG
jgi:hypothetical protein